MLELGHIHLKVRDLKRSILFYQLLGFQRTEQIQGAYVFLTLGKSHHDLALQQVGNNAPAPTEGMVGLYHFALEVSNQKELKKYYNMLTKHHIPMSAVDHGISKALYFKDPDGNGIEIYVDTRQHRRFWKGKTEILDMDNI